MSPFWILVKLRMMDVVVTTGAIRRTKLQTIHHHQQTNTQLFTGQMPFLSPNCVRSLKETYYKYMYLKYCTALCLQQQHQAGFTQKNQKLSEFFPFVQFHIC